MKQNEKENIVPVSKDGEDHMKNASRSSGGASGISKCTINFSYQHHHQQQRQRRPRYYSKEPNHSKAEKAFITKLESKPLFFNIAPNSELTSMTDESFSIN